MTIQSETKEVLRAPLIGDTVQAAAYMMEINPVFSGLNSDGIRGNGFKL